MYLELKTMSTFAVLLSRRHHGVRVVARGEANRANQPPTVFESGFDPLTANAEVAVAAEPMRVNPATLSCSDHFAALGSGVERR